MKPKSAAISTSYPNLSTFRFPTKAARGGGLFPTVGNEGRAPDTRIFSPLAVAGLCVPIGRYWYLFKRLTAVSAGRFYRFEHIVAHSSFKAHSKQASRFEVQLLFDRQGKVYVLPRFRHKT